MVWRRHRLSSGSGKVTAPAKEVHNPNTRDYVYGEPSSQANDAQRDIKGRLLQVHGQVERIIHKTPTGRVERPLTTRDVLLGV